MAATEENVTRCKLPFVRKGSCKVRINKRPKKTCITFDTKSYIDIYSDEMKEGIASDKTQYNNDCIGIVTLKEPKEGKWSKKKYYDTDSLSQAIICQCECAGGPKAVLLVNSCNDKLLNFVKENNGKRIIDRKNKYCVEGGVAAVFPKLSSPGSIVEAEICLFKIEEIDGNLDKFSVIALTLELDELFLKVVQKDSKQDPFKDFTFAQLDKYINTGDNKRFVYQRKQDASGKICVCLGLPKLITSLYDAHCCSCCKSVREDDKYFKKAFKEDGDGSGWFHPNDHGGFILNNGSPRLVFGVHQGNRTVYTSLKCLIGKFRFFISLLKTHCIKYL